MNKKIIIEVCANSIDSALAAQQGGADRIELCCNLIEGGTTPSFATIEFARSLLSIRLNVLIRPRGGDFLYSNLEFEIMKRDIEVCKKMGVDGVVFGVLDENGNIDKVRTKELIKAARPMNVTFHRAFDMSNDPFQALSVLMDMGVERLLTSGQQEKALDGISLIEKLVTLAGDKIIIMPGSGITSRNIKEIILATGAKEYHMTGKKGMKSRMTFKNTQISMGGDSEVPEYLISITDADEISRVVSQVNNE
jgi:copper homeostasis protein